MRFRILFGAAALVASLGTAATGLVATASAAHATALTCTGGDFAMGQFTTIQSGTYSSITVKGACNIEPNAVINVTGNIRVAAGAVLDAQSAPAVITVGHNVTAGPGSILGMGCQPSNTIGMFAGVPCAADPTGQTVITVRGNVTAGNANTVLLRKLTVGGNISLAGGGGDIPWSIKGNTVGGNITISSVSADWLGVQFNTVSRNVVLHNITVLDPGDPGRTVAVVENTVANNLICSGLAPGVSGGFIPGEVNHVGHQALGQCAALV
ncbi:MAG TPA: hypothetical protein VFH74_09070 [Gaiellales bacterium]|nr:hypothetical protein [Gaiellales bacterium]